MTTFDPETISELTHLLGEEFDPATSTVDFGSGWDRYPTVYLDTVDRTKYIMFQKKEARAPYDPNPVSGVLPDNFRTWDDPQNDEEYTPDDEVDRTMHGLIESREGYIALYYPKSHISRGVFRFDMINGPEGANTAHAKLGRTPSVDMPRFVIEAVGKTHNIHTAGQITQQMAEMQMPVTPADDFMMAKHDLGSIGGVHGLYWPHAHPALYKHFERYAQNVVATFGDRIHADYDERPKEAENVPRGMDMLVGFLRMKVDDVALDELRIRDGRYDDVSDDVLIEELIIKGIKRSNYHHIGTSRKLLFLTKQTSEAESKKRGYWTNMQLFAGVVDARIALHEVQPHPEASTQVTSRTLSILRAVKKELDRRFSYVQEFLLPS